MGYKFTPNGSYMMPANFGTMKLYKSPHYTEVTSFYIQFLTEKEGIEKLLPDPMEPGDPPIVTIGCSVNKGVEFLAGGGYNLIFIGLSAVFRGKKDNVAGSYAAVFWENDTYCCILGREYLGIPKLYATIPEPKIEGNTRTFYCSEYGHKLLEGHIKNMVPADETTLKQLKQQYGRTYMLGWKYIPKANMKGADLSIPVVTPFANNFEQLWIGEGSHRFFKTAWEDTPVSAHIMKGLRSLKVKEYMPAMVTRCSQEIVMSEARTLR